MEFLLKRFTPIIFFFFLANCSNTIFHLSRGEEDSEQFGECSRPYKCGDIKSLPLPFWGGDNPPDHCGHPEFKVSCKENNSVFKINDVEYRILNLSHYNQTNKIRITRLDLSEDPCSPHRPYVNSTLSNRYGLNLYFPPTFENLTLFYGCRSFNTTTVLYTIDSLLESLQPNRLPHSCQGIVQVPILRNAFGELPSSGKQLGMDKVREVLSQGFEVHYPEFEGCRECRPSHSNIYGWKLGVIIGATTGGIAILLISITVWFCKITTLAFRTTSVWKSTTSFFKNTTLAVRTTSVWKNIIKGDQDQDIEAFIRNYGHLTVKRYRFSDIKKMTESFKDKLGKGGYGEVYRGKLLDERLVAVKLLKSTKGNGQEFINEVVSISRTSHVNIVSLLGFCLEDGKRALIYEFMPNGSLEKFIYNDCQLPSIPQLAWEKLLQIAIGIARGLEYLHRGCNTRILHFDIKPHNILLDEDLCPKIADFGLAKLCPKKESIVSLLDARGTIGYIAPEVFNRKFGGVSSKSDVYSYGMMILEMAGGRKNIKVETGHTSEIYFPDWIYKRLQQGSNLELWGEITSEENEIAKKMVIVGLWCIQTMPSDRPSMSKVIEMLEGSLEALHVPQKPSLFAPSSPERLATELAAESSTT